MSYMPTMCPKCNSENRGKYFCLSCGEVINDSTIVSNSPNEMPFVFKKRFIKDISVYVKYIGIPILVLFLIISAFLSFKFLKSNKNFSSVMLNSFQHPLKAQKTTDSRVIEKNLPLSTIEFFKSTVITFIPADADIYLEGKDFIKFLTEFTAFKISLPFNKNEVKLSDASPLVEEGFSVFSKVYESSPSFKTRAYGLIVKSKEPAKLASLFSLGKVKESSYSLKIVDDYAIFANNTKIFDDVVEAKNKRTLNLSLNSKFATNKNGLPENGKLFMYIQTKKAQEDLQNFSKENFFNETFKQLIEELIKTDKISYVIR